MGEALSLLSCERFDAAVCTVEAPRDILSVIRFKKASPRTPVLALTSEENSPIATLSLQMGVAAVLRRESDPSATADVLKRALSTEGLARQMRDRFDSPLRNVPEGSNLSARARILAADALSNYSRNPAEGFEPLLVENDPDEALFFIRALQKAGLHRRLPIVRTAEEAIDYLTGRREFENRVRHPMPTIVILDLHLGNESGEDVLNFIRSQPCLERLPVVLFSSSQDPAEVGRMVDLGVSAHLVKPHSMAELCEVVRLILDFWQVWRSQSADAPRVSAGGAL